MNEHHLLTLDEAVARSGYRKKTLIALLHNGRLPGARRDGEWLIAAADLSSLPPPAKSAAASAAPKAQRARLLPPDPGHHELDALLTLLRDRDQQVAALQDERARLAGQVGFLQAQLLERESRIRLLEGHFLHTQELVAAPAPLELLPASAQSSIDPILPSSAAVPIAESGGDAPTPEPPDSATGATSPPDVPPTAPADGGIVLQQGTAPDPADTAPNAGMALLVQPTRQSVLPFVPPHSFELQQGGVITRRGGPLLSVLRFLGLRA